MSNGHADLQAIRLSKANGMQHPDPKLRDPGVHCPEFWFKEESASDPNVQTKVGPAQHKKSYFRFKSDSKDPRFLHEMYCELIPAYGALWQTAFDNRMDNKSFKERWDLGWDANRMKWNSEIKFAEFYQFFRSNLLELLGRAPEAEEAAMARAGITSGAASWSSMSIGNVRFEDDGRKGGGSWVLSRPPADLSRDGDGELLEHAHPDFGQIQSIYMHEGPDGVFRLITRMKWYERVLPMYHATLRCPLVSTKAATNEVGVMWPASKIVPWVCMAMPLGKKCSQQVMLARSWSVLRHLGFPTQHHSYPYPHLPPVVSDKNQDRLDPIMEETDSEDEDYDPESDENSESEEVSMDEEEFDPNDVIA